ncbi:hypothetical protein [Maribacter halichondriae]|uniref:hypothetical protein n=1 Tax=Maribacter halichondriae TaxID=2980554 RepID=UPI002358965D|nr:hypothetical protein [Maribacter sp. Hal144]
MEIIKDNLHVIFSVILLGASFLILHIGSQKKAQAAKEEIKSNTEEIVKYTIGQLRLQEPLWLSISYKIPFKFLPSDATSGYQIRTREALGAFFNSFTYTLSARRGSDKNRPIAIYALSNDEFIHNSNNVGISNYFNLTYVDYIIDDNYAIFNASYKFSPTNLSDNFNSLEEGDIITLGRQPIFYESKIDPAILSAVKSKTIITSGFIKTSYSGKQVVKHINTEFLLAPSTGGLTFDKFRIVMDDRD